MASSTARVRFAFPRTVMALVLREMSTTYGRSPGGYLWAFVEPIGGLAMMTLVFSMIARTPPLGPNFPLFFATGILPLGIYQSTMNNIAGSIRYSKPLLSYPSVTYVDAVVARLILNTVTQMLIAVIILTSITLIYNIQLEADYLITLRGFAMAVVFGTAVGLANCYVVSTYPIWQSIWAVLNRPIFVISGIFFLIDPLNEKVRTLLLYNPIAHSIMQVRNGLYDNYDGIYVSESYVYMVSLVLGAGGMLALHRYYNEILEEGA